MPVEGADQFRKAVALEQACAGQMGQVTVVNWRAATRVPSVPAPTPAEWGRASGLTSPGRLVVAPASGRPALPPLPSDHRPFNGSHAASFLRTIKHNLESFDLQKFLGS